MESTSLPPNIQPRQFKRSSPSPDPDPDGESLRVSRNRSRFNVAALAEKTVVQREKPRPPTVRLGWHGPRARDCADTAAKVGDRSPGRSNQGVSNPYQSSGHCHCHGHGHCYRPYSAVLIESQKSKGAGNHSSWGLGLQARAKVVWLRPPALNVFSAPSS